LRVQANNGEDAAGMGNPTRNHAIPNQVKHQRQYLAEAQPLTSLEIRRQLD